MRVKLKKKKTKIGCVKFDVMIVSRISNVIKANNYLPGLHSSMIYLSYIGCFSTLITIYCPVLSIIYVAVVSNMIVQAEVSFISVIDEEVNKKLKLLNPFRY